VQVGSAVISKSGRGSFVINYFWSSYKGVR
jgi:hypothetical protein